MSPSGWLPERPTACSARTVPARPRPSAWCELVSQVGEKDRITLSANGSLAAFTQACRSLEGIERADVTDSSVQLLAQDGRLRLPQVLEAATRTGTSVRSVEVLSLIHI